MTEFLSYAMGRAWDIRRESGAAGDPTPDELDQWLGDLAAESGLAIRPVPAHHPALAGGLAVLDREAVRLYLRDDMIPERRRFAIAHELGHWFLHGDDFPSLQNDEDEDEDWFPAVGYSPQERREAEANAFGRSLLVDRFTARELLTTTQHSVSSLANRWGVPIDCVRHAALSPDLLPSIIAGDPQPVPLDATQHEAATASERIVLVDAGPGTGKTQSLVARVHHLVETVGVDPGRVLVLTFSRAAVNTVEARLRGLAGGKASRVAISTVHAYALDIVRRHHDRLGLPVRPLLLSPPDIQTLIWKDISGLPKIWDSSPLLAEEAIHELAQWVAEPVPAGECPEWAPAVLDWFQSTKKALGALDFNDMLVLAGQLLRQFPDIREAEQNIRSHVLVDEMQDIDGMQWDIIEALIEGTPSSLWMVGDPRQRIFSFRDNRAKPTCLSDTAPTPTKPTLGVNYRSSKKIVATLGVVSEGDRDFWDAQRTEFGQCILAKADSDEAQIHGIADALREARADGIAWSDMAVLFRSHAQKSRLRDALRQRGVPVHDEKATAVRPDSGFAKMLESIVSVASDDPRTGPLAPDSFDLTAFIDSLIWGSNPVVDCLDEAHRNDARTMLELSRTFRPLEFIYRLPGESIARAFVRFVHRRLEFGSLATSSHSDAAPRESVTMTTIHATKGREFSFVIVPNLNNKRFPLAVPSSRLGIPRKPTDFEEEQRLFFVGISRARERLLISHIAGNESPLIGSLGSLPDRVQWDYTPNLTDPESMPKPAENVTESTVAANRLLEWTRCPARVAFSETEALEAPIDFPHTLFHRVFVESLFSDNPASAFDSAWAEAMQVVPVDIGAYLRSVGQQTLKGLKRAFLVASGQTRFARLGSRRIAVRVDGFDHDGRPVRVRLGSPPVKQLSSQDARDFLLLSAFGDNLVHGYPKTQDCLPVRMTEGARAKISKALESTAVEIENRVAVARPERETQCGTCPYWYRCPRDGTPVAWPMGTQGNGSTAGNPMS